MKDIPADSLFSSLSPSLFWDVSPTSLDLEHHSKWLVQRVLERGTWEDWQLVSDRLGVDVLTRLETELRLHPRERNFLSFWIRHHGEN